MAGLRWPSGWNETRRAKGQAAAWKQHRRVGVAVFVTVPGLIIGTTAAAGAYGIGRLSEPEHRPCTPQVVTAPARGSFGVVVFNASGVDGTAKAVGKDLLKRGFRVTGTESLLEGAVKERIEIHHGDASVDQALLLAQQLPRAQVVNDGRPGRDVALILGMNFPGLIPVPPPKPPRPSQVTVNVYNATWRPGLAGAAQRELVARGFVKGRSGNDPARSFLPDEVAVIRHGEDGLPAAKVVAQHVPGATLKQVDRAGTAVDVVLGNRFTDLAPASSIPVPPPEKPKPPATVTRPCP